MQEELDQLMWELKTGCYDEEAIPRVLARIEELEKAIRVQCSVCSKIHHYRRQTMERRLFTNPGPAPRQSEETRRMQRENTPRVYPIDLTPDDLDDLLQALTDAIEMAQIKRAEAQKDKDEEFAEDLKRREEDYQRLASVLRVLNARAV